MVLFVSMARSSGVVLFSYMAQPDFDDIRPILGMPSGARDGRNLRRVDLLQDAARGRASGASYNGLQKSITAILRAGCAVVPSPKIRPDFEDLRKRNHAATAAHWRGC